MVQIVTHSLQIIIRQHFSFVYFTRAVGGPVFGRNFFESDLAENFTIDAARDVESIMKFSGFFLAPLGRYLLITY